MRPDPTARDARDTNRATALRALQERDEARRQVELLREQRDTWEQVARDSMGTPTEFQKRRMDAIAEKAEAAMSERDATKAKLAAIDALHQPDPDNPAACLCGATHPCKTRRELDR